LTNLVPTTWRDSVGQLRDKVSGIFDRWLPARSDTALAPTHDTWPGFLATGWGPAVDIAETADEVVVTAEMPGLDSKDFQVNVDGRRLTLRGEKRATREEKGRAYCYTESSYGAFHRVLELPCAVETDKAKARYQQGVLTVQLPKTEEARAHKVKVEVN